MKQKDLAESLDVSQSEITNLNDPRRRGNPASVKLARNIEWQLVAWRLENSLEELRELRRAVGASDFDRNDPHDREVMEEVEQRHGSSTPKAAPSSRLDERKANYVRRPEHDVLRDKILNSRAAEQQTYGLITAVKGTGGGGKTTLAEAVVDELVNKYKDQFDGSIRLVFSKKHDAAARISDAIRQLEGTILGPAISSVEEGMRLLIATAHTSKKRPVVFFDDVWAARDVAPYLDAFHHCPVVITTRFAEVVAEIDAETIPLDEYTPDQALEQLSDGLPTGEEDRLRSLARALRYWPLALSLANAFIRRKLKKTDPPFTLAEAIDLAVAALKDYGITAFDRGDDNPARSTNASIQIVLSLLDPAAALAFAKLAVFPEDAWVPRDLLTRWLEKLEKSGWTPVRVRDFCGELRDLSLTQGYEGLTHPFIQLHDHIWLFLRTRHKDGLPAWQREFLGAVRPPAIPEDPGEPWPSSPWARMEAVGNDYLWRNLEYHLTEAGLENEWREAVWDWHFIAGRAAATREDLSDITGWDSRLLSEAQSAEDPNEFVLKLNGEKNDLAGAAHCAGLPVVRHRIHESTRELLRGLLRDVTRSDPDHRRRDLAIRALFEIGHPQYQVNVGTDGMRYIGPSCHPVHGYTYPLGDDNPPYDDPVRSSEIPLHRWRVSPFEIGIYPVTNAEMAWFVRAGGYDDERWWVGEDARGWRERHWREAYRRSLDVGWLVYVDADEPFHISPLVTREDYQSYVFWLRYFSGRRRDDLPTEDDWEAAATPYPREISFGHPAQPATWVCFYEAVAYCRWLSNVSGKRFELPTEDEWEAAARGTAGRPYPFAGSFDKARANTHESKVRRTTPVGAYPEGATPEDVGPNGTTPGGIHDLSGNVWEWTTSGFELDPDQLDAFLPARDIRPNGSNDVNRDWPCRVVRGGSWDSDLICARATFRFMGGPASRANDLGFRVVMRP